jgi:predicted CXXCH cytochrome family protein
MKIRASYYTVISISMALLLSANIASGGLVGSVHDFSSEGWSGGEICAPCHTPHNADTSAGGPLWDHEIDNSTAYTTYASPTLVGTPEQPRAITKLCLSCHDGVVAIDSFGGTTGSVFISGTANLKTDLSDDHPVSILWEHQKIFTAPICGNCHNFIDPNWVRILPFPDEFVECVTCHDVHDNTGFPQLLRITMSGSELCLYCHEK